MAEPVTLRTVERFPEPLFTELVGRLLHDPDRQAVSALFLPPGAGAPTATAAQQIRIGAFAGEALVGWSHAYLYHGGTLHVANSAVLPEFRRQGIYTRLMAAVEAEAMRLGCLRVESQHQATNAAVLIAKLKAGYIIVGTEFTGEAGLLVKMAKPIDPARQRLLAARAGGLGAAVRFFRAADGG